MTSPSTPPPPYNPGAEASGFATTWRRVITEPRAFFAEMPQAGGLRDPLIFLAICAVINALGVLVWQWSVSAAIGAVLRMLLHGIVLGAITTLIAQQLFDGPAGFESTFRAVAYAAAPLVIVWFPGLGMLAQAYAWYLAIRGIESVHRFDAPRAVLTVAVGVVLLWYAGVGQLCGGPPMSCHPHP